MNEDDIATEARLRRAARESHPGATAVLADFYEERGQQSRAALWRRPDRDEKTDGERDRTCIKTITRLSPIDPRRDAMIWLLCIAGLPLPSIGQAFKLCKSRVRGIANRIDREVYLAARAESMKTEPVARRLRAVGAILTLPDAAAVHLMWQAREERERRQRILRVELPPDSWPYTRPHEERRR